MSGIFLFTAWSQRVTDFEQNLKTYVVISGVYEKPVTTP